MTRRVCCLVADRERRRETVASLAEALSSASVTAVSTPDELCSELAAGTVDCVVVGHDEPTLDALAVLADLRERDPSLPAIVVPRDGSEALASATLGAGATDYVRRADGVETLADRIERATDRQPPTADTGWAILDALENLVVYDPADDAIDDVGERLRTRVCTQSGISCEGVLTGRDSDGEDDSLESQFRAAIETGHRQVEWRCETADGESRWAEIVFERVDLADGPIVVARCRDVTGHRHRARRLRSFRRAVEHAGHSIYVTERDGTIRYANPTFEEVTGYSADEAVGETPRILKSGVHDRPFYADLWRTVLDGDVWENQIVNERKDGERYVANQTIAPITDDDGEIVNFVTVNADITGQKRREKQYRRLHVAVRSWLEASNREAAASLTTTHLEEFLDISLGGIFLYDEERERLRPAASTETADELVDDQPSFASGDGIAWRAFETGATQIYDDVRDASNVYNPETPVRTEVAIPLGDHGVLLVGSQDVAAFDETELTLVRLVASSLETTFDRLERERELERQKDRFENFSHVVSHDLRNPLTVAMGELERAREVGDQEAFDSVERAHERIADIIDDLLSLAREGATVGNRRPVSLDEIASSAWENVDTPAASLELDCDRRVAADPGRLEQLFENLFRNAVEHGVPDEGARSSAAEALSVRVGVTDDGFYVADDGVGIPESEREAVIETGYTTSDWGTGLGLSIVSSVVDAHGWELAVDESDAGGARFTVRSGFVD